MASLAVQGLAFGLDKPVVPIVTLAAMAQACRVATGALNVLVVLDARMGEVYWAQYRFDEEWIVVIEPTLSVPSAVMPVGEVSVCGNGLLAYPSEFSSDFSASTLTKNTLYEVRPHAAQIAQLADWAFQNGQSLAAREAQPLYLRNKIALTTSERLAKANSLSA